MAEYILGKFQILRKYFGQICLKKLKKSVIKYFSQWVQTTLKSLNEYLWFMRSFSNNGHFMLIMCFEMDPVQSGWDLSQLVTSNGSGLNIKMKRCKLVTRLQWLSWTAIDEIISSVHLWKFEYNLKVSHQTWRAGLGTPIIIQSFRLLREKLGSDYPSIILPSQSKDFLPFLFIPTRKDEDRVARM